MCLPRGFPGSKEEKKKRAKRKRVEADGGRNICQCCTPYLGQEEKRARERASERKRAREREREREGGGKKRNEEGRGGGRKRNDGHTHANDVYARTSRTIQGFSTRSLEIWDPLDKAGPLSISVSLPLLSSLVLSLSLSL